MHFRHFIALFAAVLVFVTHGSAATHLVDSIASLKSKLHAAAAGDVITLKDGTYTTTSGITIRATGTAEQPIVVQAESVGGVEITGTHGFTVVEPAAHIVIVGFKLTHNSGRNIVGAGTSHVRFTRNLFQCQGDGAYLSVSGDDARIDHNEFSEKSTAGGMLALGGTGNQVARRAWIHHNYFHDLTTPGTASSEMLRVGLSAHAQSTGAAVVEHNLFTRCRGENEIVSNRSSGNVYRFNTLTESPSSQLTLRHGNACAIYGNYFRNTEGLRLFGDQHLVHSNHLEGNYIGINLGNGSSDGAGDASGAGHDRPDNCVIVFNTLVENRTHFQMSRRSPDGLGATGTIFAHNILLGGATAAKLEGPYTNPTWSGNYVWNVRTLADFPVEGFTDADPLLELSRDSVARPKKDSPVIGAVENVFPAVTVDVDGQPRPLKRTLGADEPADTPVTARVLSASDVGPQSPEHDVSRLEPQTP